MIKKFKRKSLRKPFELGNTSGVQFQYSKRIKRILALLETVGTIEDMDLPDLKIHELRGILRGITLEIFSFNQYEVINRYI